MPIYEYFCEGCDKIFEHLIMHPVTKEKELKVCPDCGKDVKKIVSQTDFRLKGSGWYMTTFESEKRKYTKSDLQKKREEKTETAPSDGKPDVEPKRVSPIPGEK